MKQYSRKLSSEKRRGKWLLFWNISPKSFLHFFLFFLCCCCVFSHHLSAFWRSKFTSISFKVRGNIEQKVGRRRNMPSLIIIIIILWSVFYHKKLYHSTRSTKNIVKTRRWNLMLWLCLRSKNLFTVTKYA